MTAPLTSARGFEPPTPRLGGECSIQLSYVDNYNMECSEHSLLPFFSFTHSLYTQIHSLGKFKVQYLSGFQACN